MLCQFAIVVGNELPHLVKIVVRHTKLATILDAAEKKTVFVLSGKEGHLCLLH